jgi:hypothetical protein
MIGVIMWAGCPAQSRFPRLRRDERAQSHTASALRPSGRYFGCRRAGRLDWRQGRSPGYYAESLECRAGRQDAALYGSRMPAAGVWTFSALLNPERMRSLSSGLRAARYPGWAMGWGVNPERVASFVPFTGVNPTHTVRRMRVRTASANASEIVVQFLP